MADKIIRKPIKIPRKSIKLSIRERLYLKLRQVQEETKKDDIIEIANHYNMLVVEKTKKAGHTVLPYKNPEKSKHWVHFETVYEICRLQQWNPKVYIEAQFDRAKGWKKIPYPYPNSLHSANALRHYIKYYGDMRRKYEKDANKKRNIVEKDTVTVQELIRDSIKKDCLFLKQRLKNSKEKGRDKALTLFSEWVNFSPFYLWSVPWFHDIVPTLSGKRADKIKIEFDRIDTSPMMKNTIRKSVQEMEDKFDIPHNISL